MRIILSQNDLARLKNGALVGAGFAAGSGAAHFQTQGDGISTAVLTLVTLVAGVLIVFSEWDGPQVDVEAPLGAGTVVGDYPVAYEGHTQDLGVDRG